MGEKTVGSRQSAVKGPAVGKLHHLEYEVNASQYGKITSPGRG